jgi:hypothetical protein
MITQDTSRVRFVLRVLGRAEPLTRTPAHPGNIRNLIQQREDARQCFDIWDFEHKGHARDMDFRSAQGRDETRSPIQKFCVFVASRRHQVTAR